MIYQLANTSLTYTIRRYRRSKHMRANVSQSGEVVVTGPTYVSIRALRAFADAHADVIAQHVVNATHQKNPDMIATDKEHFLRHKKAALALARKKVLIWNSFYHFEHGRITVRQLKSRWGSCSSNKNLSFNYKILFLSEELQDYLVVHELCHLREMNHSRNFWALVERAIPEYRRLRREFKKL